MKAKSLLILSLLLSISIYSSGQVYDSLNITKLSSWTNPTVTPEPFYGIKYNGIWGWNDTNGNEYAIIGSSQGTYFVDVTNPSNPIERDYVAGKRNNCIWREIKTYSHYAYLISDDGAPNSFQIVDLQYLPDSVHVVLDNNTIFERSHTLFIDGNKLYCASTNGGSVGSSDMSVFSLANPELPVLLRKLDSDYPSLTNGVHDMYIRNDTCYVSGGYSGLFILKFNTTTNQFNLINSLTSYPSQGYNHSSILTDDGQTLIFMDEVPNGLPVKSLDVTDLQNLVVATTFSTGTTATPHNPFMIGNTCYIAYYQDGLQVYDVSDRNNPVRIGFYDTHYQTAMGGPYPNPAYQGAWGAYPYLPSGNILVSDMQNGLFVLTQPTATGISENNKKTISSVYPNPIKENERLFFKGDVLELNAIDVKLMHLIGQDVLVRANINPKEGLDLTGVKQGIYLMQVLSGNEMKSRVKVVVED